MPRRARGAAAQQQVQQPARRAYQPKLHSGGWVVLVSLAKLEEGHNVQISARGAAPAGKDKASGWFTKQDIISQACRLGLGFQRRHFVSPNGDYTLWYGRQRQRQHVTVSSAQLLVCMCNAGHPCRRWRRRGLWPAIAMQPAQGPVGCQACTRFVYWFQVSEPQQCVCAADHAVPHATSPSIHNAVHLRQGVSWHASCWLSTRRQWRKQLLIEQLQLAAHQ